MSSKRIVTALVALCVMGVGCEEKSPPRPAPGAGGATGMPPRAAGPNTAAPSGPAAPAALPAATGGTGLQSAIPGMPVTPPAMPGAGGSGSTVSVLGLKTSLPEGWKQVPPANQMRLAEATVPDASGDPAKACVVTFSTAGGDVQGNIDRWSGQVKDAAGQPVKPKVETKTVAGMKVSVAELTGMYTGMGDTAPHADWTLRGAIVETPAGLLFVKMWGPKEQMEKTSAAFNSMIDGLKPG